MKDDQDIDALLRRQVERQLAGFDWDELRSGITRRLAGGVRPKRRINYGKWAAVAAAIGMTAGLAFLGLSLGRRPDAPGGPAGQARVTLLATTRTAGKAEVSLAPAEEWGRCEVRLIEVNETPEERREQASLWIVAVHQPSGDDADPADIACLF